MKVYVTVSTKELNDKGLLGKALEISKRIYPYPSIEISDSALITLTAEQAAEIGLLKIEATDKI
jgi:hypothetical protein